MKNEYFFYLFVCLFVFVGAWMCHRCVFHDSFLVLSHYSHCKARPFGSCEWACLLWDSNGVALCGKGLPRPSFRTGEDEHVCCLLLFIECLELPGRTFIINQSPFPNQLRSASNIFSRHFAKRVITKLPQYHQKPYKPQICQTLMTHTYRDSKIIILDTR